MGRRSPTTASVRSRRIALRLRSRAVWLALFYWLHRVSCVSSAERFPKVPPISYHGIERCFDSRIGVPASPSCAAGPEKSVNT